MEIIIESPHFTLDRQLQEYTLQKVGKLAHFDEKLLKSEVLLKVEKWGADENKVCEIKAKAHHADLFASSKSATFEDAIIQSVHALEKQLKKHKTLARRDGKKMDTDDIID
jgi:putative sigma-54 modulation protein